MSGNEGLRITLATVQARSQPGQVAANLQHAEPLVEQAAAQGARLVVLPELFSCGYVPNRAVWGYAEPCDGPTSRWLAATAGRLGIYLGAGSAETDGTDFFNVFILAGPDGRVAGRAYKTNAEASVFRRGRRDHLIATPAGRIGIGICADNQFAAHQRRMVELPVLYARSLGVPVVFVNQVGPLLPVGGILGRLMDSRIWRLRGQSRIVGPDGSVLGQLDDDEGVLTAQTVMGPAREDFDAPPSFGGWLQPGPWTARHLIIPVDIAVGRLSYVASCHRRRMARLAVAATEGPLAFRPGPRVRRSA